MTFATQLQSARTAAGLSQSQAALAMIRSASTLRKWEQGVNTPHPMTQASALSALKAAERKSLNPHRPDVKPGRGYRILETGECPQPGDEAKLGKAWLPVEAGRWRGNPFETPMTDCCVAIRTTRLLKPNVKTVATEGAGARPQKH